MPEQTPGGRVPIVVRGLQLIDYQRCREQMQAFTEQRGPETADEIWLVEHRPVFTQGLAGKTEHLLDPGDIPVIRTERGGQVTYHGPGQLVVYLLIDLRRRALTVKSLVWRLEQGLIDALALLGIVSVRRPGAPGVYVAGQGGEAGSKIAALGLKVSRGCTYHGIALNVAMDLQPFSRINPCGYAGLTVTDIRSVLAGAGTPSGATSAESPAVSVAGLSQTVANCLIEAIG